MVPKKVVILGSKPIGYECLAWAISQREMLHIEITGILTRQRKEFGGEHDLEKLAQNFNIPVLAALEQLPECDILYSVQYHEILRAEHIQKARQAAVNLHMAPLPEYRGSNQFSFALLDGKTEFGTTIHLLDERIDHGAILFQKRFPIPEDCWVQDLYQLTYDASVRLFRQTFAHIVQGNYHPVPQQDLVPKYGTNLHYKKEMESLKVIDLGWDRAKIEQYIRATSMPGFEPPYGVVNGRKVHFTTDPEKPL